MKTRKQVHHMWTKEEIKKVIKLWDTGTMQGIADDIGVTKDKLSSLVSFLRNKKGIKLSRKRQNGYLGILVDEVKQELKLK